MAPGPEHIALVPETKNRMTRCAVTLEKAVVRRGGKWEDRIDTANERKSEKSPFFFFSVANIDVCTILRTDGRGFLKYQLPSRSNPEFNG